MLRMLSGTVSDLMSIMIVEVEETKFAHGSGQSLGIGRGFCRFGNLALDVERVSSG